MSGVELAIAICVVFAGASLQGSIGFGLAMVSAPILAIIEPDLLPGSLLLLSGVSTFMLLVRERAGINVREIVPAVVGRFPGVAAGAAAVALLAQDGLALLLGAIVLAASVAYARGFTIERTNSTKFGAGMLSGFGATSVGIGGPPMALLYSNVEGPTLRATMTTYFGFGLFMSMSALAIVGELGRYQLRLALPLVPAIVMGIALSSKLTPILDRSKIRPLVLGVSATSAVVVIAKTLL